MVLDRDNQLSGNGSPGDGLDAHRASARIDEWLTTRSPDDANHEDVFEALRVRMQEIEDRCRGRSPLAAQIIDDIGHSPLIEDVLRHLIRLDEHIRSLDGSGSAGRPETARRQPAVRTLIRL